MIFIMLLVIDITSVDIASVIINENTNTINIASNIVNDNINVTDNYVVNVLKLLLITLIISMQTLL